jgi:hypothetical protein
VRHILLVIAALAVSCSPTRGASPPVTTITVPAPSVVNTGGPPSPAPPLLVYRSVHVGAAFARCVRLTYALARAPSDPTFVTMILTTESGPHGTLDGTENDPRRWPERAVTTWEGRHLGDRMTLTAIHAGPGEAHAMALTCQDTVVKTLAPRALPIQISTRADLGPTHRWEPRESEDVHVLRCAQPATESVPELTLSFAPSPGVEWAFESINWSDPQGAFRRLAP